MERVLVGLIAAMLLSACGASGSSTEEGAGGGAGGHGGHDHHHGTGVATGASCPTDAAPTWEEFGEPFMQQYCTRCHAASVTGEAREGAPDDVNLETREGVLAWAEQIDLTSGHGPDAHNELMPPDGATPTEAERTRLAEWLACEAPAAGGRVTIELLHHVGGEPIVLGPETPYVNAAGDEFGVTRVQWFLSELEVTLADGRKLTHPGAHYVDAELPETQSLVLDGHAEGAIASVSFVMGLSAAANVTGAFPSAPEALMEWPEMMGGGYHLMKFEGRYVNAAGEPFHFKAHAGPLHGVDYSFPVTLDAGGLTVGEGGATLPIVMNLESWFATPNTWDLDDYYTVEHPGIMGDAAAQLSLQQNGADVFSLGGHGHHP